MTALEDEPWVQKLRRDRATRRQNTFARGMARAAIQRETILYKAREEATAVYRKIGFYGFEHSQYPVHIEFLTKRYVTFFSRTQTMIKGERR